MAGDEWSWGGKAARVLGTVLEESRNLRVVYYEM